MASLTTVTVGTVAITASIQAPTQPQKPTEAIPPPTPIVQTISVLDYYQPLGDGALDSPMYYYDVGFTFEMNEFSPQSVSIVGQSYDEYEPNTAENITPIEKIIPADALIVNEDNTVTAVFTVEDITRTYSLRAILNYTDGQTNTLSSLQTEKFIARIPKLNATELRTKNNVITVISDTEITCTIVFEEFTYGCFDFKTELLTIYYENDQIVYGGEGNPPVPEIKNGKLQITETFPRPQGDSIVLAATLEGDSYYNGQKMNMESSTHVSKEIILGTAYSAEKINFNPDDTGMSANGLTVTNIEYLTNHEGLKESVPQILPGSAVTISITLEGSAIATGSISADITVNEQKITDADFTYAKDAAVTAGDTQVVLEFTFTMPSQDITADDIVINAITFA